MALLEGSQSACRLWQQTPGQEEGCCGGWPRSGVSVVSASFPGREGKGWGYRVESLPSLGTNASSEPPHFPSIVVFDAALLRGGGQHLRDLQSHTLAVIPKLDLNLWYRPWPWRAVFSSGFTLGLSSRLLALNEPGEKRASEGAFPFVWAGSQQPKNKLPESSLCELAALDMAVEEDGGNVGCPPRQSLPELEG